MKRFRIVLVSAFPPGTQSLNEYGLHLACNFAADPRVESVLVIADKISGSAEELSLSRKITVRRVWRFNSLLTPFSIRRAIPRGSVDLVLFNIHMAAFGNWEVPAALGLLSVPACRSRNHRTGVIAHNIFDGIDLSQTKLQGQVARQRIVRLAGGIVTRLVLTADYTTVTLRSYFDALARRFPSAKVFLIPHGTFDTPRSSIKSLPSQRRLRIVTMGKFGTYKRLETLLAAFDLLRAQPRFSHLELFIGGTDHPAAANYMASVRSSRQDDPGVVFTGYVPEAEVAKFFEDGRLSVFDYVATTGSSGVLHQAASYGSVPVFPIIGDFEDLVREEGFSGLHYIPGDPESLATALEAGLLSDDLCEEIARSNLEAAKATPISSVVDFHLRQIGVHPVNDPSEPVRKKGRIR